jgi:hypothetical protein
MATADSSETLEGNVIINGEEFPILYRKIDGQNVAFREPQKSFLGKRYGCEHVINGLAYSGEKDLTNGEKVYLGCGLQTLCVKSPTGEAVTVPDGITAKVLYCLCTKTPMPMNEQKIREIGGSD